MIYIFLAEGFEEIEALAPADLLRRCGKDVRIVGIGGKSIKSSHGVTVQADIEADEVILDNNLEMIVLPGGMPGADNLSKNKTVNDAVDYAVKENIYIGAICAAPVILGRRGLLEGKTVTCYPGYEDELAGAAVTSNYTERDGKIITAAGAGAALDFGLELVSSLLGDERAEALRKSLRMKTIPDDKRK